MRLGVLNVCAVTVMGCLLVRLNCGLLKRHVVTNVAFTVGLGVELAVFVGIRSCGFGIRGAISEAASASVEVARRAAREVLARKATDNWVAVLVDCIDWVALTVESTGTALLVPVGARV